MDKFATYLKARVRVLENIVEGGNVSDTLDILCRDTEEIDPAMRCSVLYFDQAANCLRHAAAPSLPDFYNEAIDGLQVGLGVGSCGTAAFTGERVIVEDVFSHPYWELFRDLAKEAGFQACWSQPILSKNKEVLGTFAMYYNETRQPTEEEIQLIQAQANLASIAIERKREDTLAETAQKQMQEAIETMSEGFALFDKNDRLVLCNSVYREMYSAHAEAIEIGNTLEEILRAGLAKGSFIDALGNEEGWLAERLKKHRNLDHPVEQRLSNGRWLLISEHRTKDGGTVGVRTDITALKDKENQLRESETQLRDFGASAADWYWEMDDNLRFSYFSDQFTEVTGVPQEALLGKTRQENGNPGATTQAWQEHLENLAHHRSFRNFIHPRTLPNGSVVWLSINGRPVFDPSGQFKGYRGTGADITTLHGLQEELVNAKEEAEKANQSKSEFLASMSHDLRTPLNAIMGFAEMMQIKAFGPLGDPKYEEYAQNIHRSGQSLVSLINDILDLSKIEAGKYNITNEDLDLSYHIRSIVSNVRILAENAGLQITVQITPDLPKFRGDGRAITQILNNLLSNAIKFSSKGKEITISSHVDDDGMFVISVADTGIGMTEDEISKALEPFEQADSTKSSKHEGTGLGLFICRNLAELHDGTLNIESEVGKGSTVTLRFPSERTIDRS